MNNGKLSQDFYDYIRQISYSYMSIEIIITWEKILVHQRKCEVNMCDN